MGGDGVDLDGKIMEGRQIEMQLTLVAVVIAEPTEQAHPELACRTTGNDIKGARFGIPSEQRALRTFEHFHALDIE